MSNINRRNFLELTTASFPDAAETTVTLARPATALPALSNNKDHVIDPQSRDEFFAGKAIVELPASLDLATVFVRRIELVRGNEGFAPNSPSFGGDIQGTNVIGAEAVGPTPGALFPSGSLGVGEPEVIFDDAVGLALGGTAAPSNDDTQDTIHRMLQRLYVKAHQSIRITFFNGSGGALNNQVIPTTYAMGRFAGDYVLQG